MTVADIVAILFASGLALALLLIGLTIIPSSKQNKRCGSPPLDDSDRYENPYRVLVSMIEAGGIYGITIGEKHEHENEYKSRSRLERHRELDRRRERFSQKKRLTRGLEMV